MRNGAPVIGLNDSGGARIQEGVVSLGGYAEIFLRNTLASGVDPADLGDPRSVRRRRGVFAGDHRLHLHGARHVVHVRHRAERREDGDARRRDDGAARRRRHARRHVGRRALRARLGAGVPRRRFASCSATSRRTTSTIRRADAGTDPRDRRDEALLDVVPDNPNKPYDMHDVIRRVVDDGEFYEVQREYAQNILCGFAHLGGFSVGIVANQPAVLAGVLDINASLKAARFIRFCDAFNIPIVTFEDVPGLPARRGAGARRHHQARREAALRVLRGDGAQAHGHHAQGVRRRVRRHVVEAHSRRLQRRVADGGDRGDGSQGRGRDSLPEGDRRERRSAAGDRREDRRVPREVRAIRTSPRAAATSTTSSIRATRGRG